MIRAEAKSIVTLAIAWSMTVAPALAASPQNAAIWSNP